MNIKIVCRCNDLKVLKNAVNKISKACHITKTKYKESKIVCEYKCEMIIEDINASTVNVLRKIKTPKKISMEIE